MMAYRITLEPMPGWDVPLIIGLRSALNRSRSLPGELPAAHTSSTRGRFFRGFRGPVGLVTHAGERAE